MPSEREKLQAVIEGLEAQRGLLGDAFVDAGLAPLRARLAELAADTGASQTLKQVTILFLDVVGSTQLSQRLDPEEIHAVMDGALARCTAIVEAQEVDMPQQWSDKRERQYEHIKDGLEERGRSEDVAEEIAARTVNKERARAGEAKAASRTSTEDISSGRRGGLRSHRGAGGRTRDQLYAEAKRKGVEGRSKMTKAELERALDRS